MKSAIVIEYDGTNYVGWQRQDNGLSVQQVIEDALFKLENRKITIFGAGRTDAGVHALGQVAHIDEKLSVPAQRLNFALNMYLPEDIRIKKAYEVPDSFHARKSARAKWYRYVFFNGKNESPFFYRTSAHVKPTIDLDLMNEALNYLLGTHDFKGFMTSGSNIRSTVRTIYEVRAFKDGDFVVIDILGSGFLYNMMRIIAGSTIIIATHRAKPEWIKQIIESEDRAKAGKTYDAKGLTLMKIYYDDSFKEGLPEEKTAYIARYFV